MCSQDLNSLSLLTYSLVLLKYNTVNKYKIYWGDFVQGDFVLGGFCPRGILSWGDFVLGGFCPGEVCPGGFCPDTMLGFPLLRHCLLLPGCSHAYSQAEDRFLRHLANISLLLSWDSHGWGMAN